MNRRNKWNCLQLFYTTDAMIGANQGIGARQNAD
jgi:hypothetical protein